MGVRLSDRIFSKALPILITSPTFPPVPPASDRAMPCCWTGTWAPLPLMPLALPCPLDCWALISAALRWNSAIACSCSRSACWRWSLMALSVVRWAACSAASCTCWGVGICWARFAMASINSAIVGWGRWGAAEDWASGSKPSGKTAWFLGVTTCLALTRLPAQRLDNQQLHRLVAFACLHLGHACAQDLGRLHQPQVNAGLVQLGQYVVAPCIVGLNVPDLGLLQVGLALGAGVGLIAETGGVGILAGLGLNRRRSLRHLRRQCFEAGYFRFQVVQKRQHRFGLLQVFRLQR